MTPDMAEDPADVPMVSDAGAWHMEVAWVTRRCALPAQLVALPPGMPVRTRVTICCYHHMVWSWYLHTT